MRHQIWTASKTRFEQIYFPTPVFAFASGAILGRQWVDFIHGAKGLALRIYRPGRYRSFKILPLLGFASALPFCFAIAFSPMSYAASYARNRMLILFAVRADDEHLDRQIGLLQKAAEGLAGRDVVIEKAVGKDPVSQSLRRKFYVEDGFHVLLIGKDGHVAISSDNPIAPGQLFDIIDAMPMRQAEMRTRALQRLP